MIGLRPFRSSLFCLTCMTSLVVVNVEYETIMKSTDDIKTKIQQIDMLLLEYKECCRSKLKHRFGYPAMSTEN